MLIVVFVMRWYLEDVEKAIRGATLKIAPVVDGIVNDLNLPKNIDVFAVGGFVRDAVLGKLVGKEIESKDIDLILSQKPDLQNNPNVIYVKQNSFGGTKLGLKKFPEVDIFNKEIDWPDMIVGQSFDFNCNSIFYYNKTQQIFAAAPFYAFTSNKTIELVNYLISNYNIKTLYQEPSLVTRALKFQVLFREKFGIDARLSSMILYLLYNMDEQTKQEMLKYTQQKIKDENLRKQVIEQYYKIKAR